LCSVMGCSSSSANLPDVQSAMWEVRVFPATGLPNLLAALEYSAKEAYNENINCDMPCIIELVTEALASLVSAESTKSVVAACGVIELVVKLHNDSIARGSKPTLNGEITQCQQRLGNLMMNVAALALDTT